MRRFQLLTRSDGLSCDLAQPAGFGSANSGETIWASRSAPARSSGDKTVAVGGAAGLLRCARVSALRLFVLALFLLPARVSLSNSVPVREEPPLIAGRGRIILDEPLACDCLGDCLAHPDRAVSRSTPHAEKRPAALRKHSRRPSPSDDDGTCPDPTNDDESSDNLIEDGTEAAIIVPSPALLYLLMTSEGTPSLFFDPSPTPLFLVLQRFRC